MYKIGLSSCGKTINEELFAAYAAAGIDVMEISPGMDAYASLNYEEMAALSRKYGVEIRSFHLPFMPFDKIDISRPELAEASIAYLSELMERATSIGIKIFVTHPSGEPIGEDERPARMACAKASLARLAAIARSRGAVIAVEDLPRTCLGRSADDVEELISVDPDLRVCFDTNHLLTGDPIEFIHRLGHKFITTHVSDYDRVNERHWLPGEGVVDWAAILAALKDVGYTGPWLYEIGFNCPGTILRDRALTCDDFVDNAKALFAGEKPPVLSRPKPNLGMWN